MAHVTFFMLSKIAGSAGLSGAIGKCFGCDYEARRGRSKGQISDIHRKSEKAREGAHLHTHLCPLLNDRPDLPCHASVSQLQTSLVRFHSPLFALLLALSVFHQWQ